MAQSYNIDGHVWLHESFMSRVNHSERPGKPLMHTACTQQYFYMYLRQANIEYDDNLRRRFFIFSCCVTRWRGGEEKKKKQDENKMFQQLPQIHNSLHQVSNWIARKRARERERTAVSSPPRCFTSWVCWSWRGCRCNEHFVLRRRDDCIASLGFILWNKHIVAAAALWKEAEPPAETKDFW